LSFFFLKKKKIVVIFIFLLPWKDKDNLLVVWQLMG
jgi:hypothetical protein